jgi:hypothetical protein
MAERGLIPQVENLSPLEAADLAHTEAQFVAKRLALRALADGRNLLLDITMASRVSLESWLDAVHRAGYVVTGVFVDIGVEESVRRAEIAAQLAAHADGHIFTSLPRSGTVRAARLLAEIGDCRAKFPDPQALICLAGAAPSTRQSGKHKAVTFRWAVSKQLRDAACNFADGSRHASPWAARICNDAIARGKDHPLAVRILARAWLYVIWECWHNGVAYDPARHRSLQRLLAEQAA